MSLYGYGRILDVDLSTGEIATRDIESEFARQYVGARSSGITQDDRPPPGTGQEWLCRHSPG